MSPFSSTRTDREPPSFFAAAFAGYGMHEKCMMNLDQFRGRQEMAAAADS